MKYNRRLFFKSVLAASAYIVIPKEARAAINSNDSRIQLRIDSEEFKPEDLHAKSTHYYNNREFSENPRWFVNVYLPSEDVQRAKKVSSRHIHKIEIRIDDIPVIRATGQVNYVGCFPKQHIREGQVYMWLECEEFHIISDERLPPQIGV